MGWKGNVGISMNFSVYDASLYMIADDSFWKDCRKNLALPTMSRRVGWVLVWTLTRSCSQYGRNVYTDKAHKGSNKCISAGLYTVSIEKKNGYIDSRQLAFEWKRMNYYMLLWV